MPEEDPKPICAFAVSADGLPKAIPLPKDLKEHSASAGYIWLHFDATDVALEKWLTRQLPVTVVSALIQAETRPRCDRIEGGLILNLRGVNLNPGADADDMVSVRLWVTEGLIISARVRKIWAVDAIRQQMVSGKAPATVSAFLAELAFGLTKRIEQVSLELVENTDALEEEALQASSTLVSVLAGLRHSVIKLRRFVRPQSQAISELSNGRAWPLDPHYAGLLQEAANQSLRTMEELDSTSDRLQAIQDQLDVMHASALGRNSYVLSVVAAIFLPLGFLTGLFGINVGGMPGVEAAYGFWVVTVGSILIGLILFLAFRYLKWL
ncbi:zinc transporter ZntB [Octadecabacter sp. CECT 8868]|uniref:zinc transporter ZntB n=1 Tax=Octadecabacter algicola TaxID=2909342 RepID=UPI001F41E9C7|nr:zinc transporter ZntB [Octadecabacter algicola]MCF2905078.1 zinc transporter ZntB [Octadecabacter algicola]